MKGTVYIARRRGELDAATPKVTARPQSEAWWADCLRDGGRVIEIEFDDDDLSTDSQVVRVTWYHQHEGRVVKGYSSIFRDELFVVPESPVG